MSQDLYSGGDSCNPLMYCEGLLGRGWSQGGPRDRGGSEGQGVRTLKGWGEGVRTLGGWGEERKEKPAHVYKLKHI